MWGREIRTGVGRRLDVAAPNDANAVLKGATEKGGKYSFFS